MSIIKSIKDIIAPKRCHSCKKEWCFLCFDCRQKLKMSTEKCFKCTKKSKRNLTCGDCKKDFFLDNVISVYKYKQDVIMRIIRKWKYSWTKDIFEDIGDILADEVSKFIELESLNKDDIIIESSPMHFWKALVRWYNQADIIWDRVSGKLSIKKFHLVKKKKLTKSQTKFWKEWRWKNLEEAFEIIWKNDITDKIIFIFDDVVTTWSTLNEIARLLKKAWAKKVIGFTFAS